MIMEHSRRRSIVAVVLIAGLLVPLGAVAGADGAGKGDPATRPVGGNVEKKPLPSPGGGWAKQLGQTVLALGVVVCSIFVARYLLGRFGAGSMQGGKAATIEILARTRISAKQQLLLVRLGRRLVLVSAGGETTAVLTEISDAEEVAALLDGLGGAGRTSPAEPSDKESQP